MKQLKLALFILFQVLLIVACTETLIEETTPLAPVETVEIVEIVEIETAVTEESLPTETATLRPTNTPRPTDTPVPATNTPVPATNTPIPATNTPIPATNTPMPATNTPMPAINTPMPATNTPIPQPTQAEPPPPPPPPSGCVNINVAGFEALQEIIHIGPDLANQIITLRAQWPFSSVDDMTRIRGIGPARLEDIKTQGLACV